MAEIEEVVEPISEIYGEDGALVDEDAPSELPPSEATRRSMRGNKSRDTRPELAVRRRLHAVGFRYRVSVRPLPGLRRTADIVFTRRRVAVFVDGCFWHRCPLHATVPRTRVAFWQAKFERNVARDTETDLLLTRAGWTVLRFWEHEDPAAVAENIANTLRHS